MKNFIHSQILQSCATKSHERLEMAMAPLGQNYLKDDATVNGLLRIEKMTFWSKMVKNVGEN